jgi:hypothetical protein
MGVRYPLRMTEINSLNLSSTMPAFAAVRDNGAAISAGLTEIARAAITIDGALGATVKGFSETLVNALNGAGNRVGGAQLESAMLDFAREAKALAIGNPDATGDDVRMIVNAAIDAGAAKSDSLPDVGLTLLDRATTFFAEAAHRLSATPPAPLFDPGVC